MSIGPERNYDVEPEPYQKVWECQSCGHKEAFHHSKEKIIFCEPCDWQHAVHIEMRPAGTAENSEQP